ncbi:dihydroorotase [Kamptonema animale CS-326]|jgi:dihydroorotase|uniref:dihydroorotase n=1 Tax=Kamptonema animale TaxID=92934 RepID=UPI002331563C|nr:dihydroorotase [Kamptonema animale]MDB9515109.1 dihydroorotase [Kamptonema animale CS-326]
MNCELLQQVRVLDPVSGTDKIADVLIENGDIKAVQESISDWPPDTQVRECQGLILGPGLVDIYSHSGEPGFEERETLESLIKAAVAGGFTRLAILPTTTPPLDRPGGLALLKSKVSNPQARIQFWGALTLGLEGQQMAELADLADSGVIGFTDGLPLSNLALVRRLLEYVKPFDLPVAFWPCDRRLAGNGAAREGVQSITLGLAGNPAIAETSALAALLELVEATGTPVHIMRVSCDRSVELIKTAKKRGLPVTASTTWMHLLLNTDAIAGIRDWGSGGDEEWGRFSFPYDPSLRLEPPLGNPDDQLALIRGVKEGAIDAIAIDHSPYTYEEKTVAFADAPPGAIGLELALSLLWHKLVETGQLSALELWRVLSAGPSLCIRQTPAVAVPGISAELTLFNPQQSWKVEHATLKSLSVNTPWLGQQLIGKVVKTWN